MLHPIFVTVLILFIAKATISSKDTDSWGGKWFPQNPLKKDSEQNDLNELFNTKKIETHSKDSWKGKWFPSIPAEETSKSNEHQINYVNSQCDDGMTKNNIDFDLENKIHSYNYLCLDHKSKYEPNFATSPIQREYIVPPAYKAPSYCLNQTIEYDERLPTFGAHRYLYPKYGEYKFLPVQRWMHNLEHGAIVMLYHPCAYQMQIEKLRSTLNACLYRHIISPSVLLLPERPLALVAWSKSLEMSVVDVPTVVNFIKQNAKKGIETKYDIQRYDAALLLEAKLVTDESDSEICANIIL